MNSFLVVALAFGYSLAYQPADLEAILKQRESYILNGTEASDGEYPYMLSLRLKNNSNHVCGASILTKNWALSSASCCANKQDMYLYSGSVNLSRGGQDHQIESMKIHEDYDAFNLWKNNICVIKVKDAFRFSSKVQQVSLPIQGSPVNDGELVNITGWGYTKHDERVTPEVLQVGKNYVALSADKCKRMTGLDHESYLCAMGTETMDGICTGDFGSPLVRKGVQVGIASWFVNPCASRRPDFYTRVPIFIDWIKKSLGKDASKLKFDR